MGFFTNRVLVCQVFLDTVAIPFRVGWGFSPNLVLFDCEGHMVCRNPFQGGMGFFTRVSFFKEKMWVITCRNPFQGGMGFFTCEQPDVAVARAKAVAIPFRVGWGFSPDLSRYFRW